MKLSPEQRQQIADEMSRIMQEAEAVANTMTLEEIKAWAIANLRPIMAEAYPDPQKEG